MNYLQFMMNQGFFHFIIFVVACAFTQEVLNLKLESDNSVPIVGENLTLSCLMRDLFKDGIIFWLNPQDTIISKCFAKGGGGCDRYTNSTKINTDTYSFTANISGAYGYINGLERARDGGTWKCMHRNRDIIEKDTVDIVIYTSPGGVNLVEPIPDDVDLGVESITLRCQTVDCTFPAPNITWHYKTNGQIAPFIGFPSYTNTSTSQCPPQEAIVTSILHLPRGTNFSGNIPLTTKFLCGITHQLLGEDIRYSNVSNDVIFAVHVSKVILVDSESGTKVCNEGFPQTLKCVSSPARPVPSIQWFLQTSNSTNATTFIANITEMNTTNNDGLHVKESEITIIPKRDQIYTIHCAGNIDSQKSVNSTIVDIDVLYVPAINVTVTGSDHLNMTWNVTCEASGFPTNYTFHPWKQLIGDVTIRSDLQGTHEGIINSSKTTLTLNRLSLQDFGTYICSVDNGVRGVNGDIIQTSSTVLKIKGKPEVVNSTNVAFTGEVGLSVNIYVAFYSEPVVTEFKFQRNSTNVENTSSSHMHLSTNDVELLFHNRNVNLSVSVAHLLLNNLTEDDFGDYNLVLENALGKTDFKVQLNLSGRELEVKGGANMAAIAGGIGAAVVVVVILVVLFFIWRKKASMLKNSSDEGSNNSVQGRSNQTGNLYANTLYTGDVSNTGYESLQACRTEASPYQALSSDNTETSDQNKDCSESMTIGSAGVGKIYMNIAITSPLSDNEYESLQSNQIETNPYQVLNDCSKDCSQPNNIRFSAGDTYSQLNPYYNVTQTAL